MAQTRSSPAHLTVVTIGGVAIGSAAQTTPERTRHDHYPARETITVHPAPTIGYATTVAGLRQRRTRPLSSQAQKRLMVGTVLLVGVLIALGVLSGVRLICLFHTCDKYRK